MNWLQSELEITKERDKVRLTSNGWRAAPSSKTFDAPSDWVLEDIINFLKYMDCIEIRSGTVYSNCELKMFSDVFEKVTIYSNEIDLLRRKFEDLDLRNIETKELLCGGDFPAWILVATMLKIEYHAQDELRDALFETDLFSSEIVIPVRRAKYCAIKKMKKYLNAV